MTWNPRLDVVEALEAFGWVGDEDNPLGLLRHSDAAWGVTSNAGDSSLTEPGGAVVEFPGDASVDLVVAACLAASGQLLDLVARAGRLTVALASAKRRARRRQPHEREGLIFHLERQNRRLSGFARLANETAQMCARNWDETREEAAKAREANGELRARIAGLERELAAERCRCPEPATACDGCGDTCHDQAVPAPA
ncbi:hypothetical protein [Streptomyces sp. NPDC012616]|uniref:hypothetical protein n=1 Tax=Streptomyces sp. NPDC012616 TaxID=3364840 RepID=UPI0036EB662C